MPRARLSEMNIAADRRLRRSALIAAPVILLLCVSYAMAGGIAPGRIISIAVPVASFIATGLLAWELRPANRMGRLMVATGACYALALIRGLRADAKGQIGHVRPVTTRTTSRGDHACSVIRV